jgi:hypothetical protein
VGWCKSSSHPSLSLSLLNYYLPRLSLHNNNINNNMLFSQFTKFFSFVGAVSEASECLANLGRPVAR